MTTLTHTSWIGQSDLAPCLGKAYAERVFQPNAEAAS